MDSIIFGVLELFVGGIQQCHSRGMVREGGIVGDRALMLNELQRATVISKTPSHLASLTSTRPGSFYFLIDLWSLLSKACTRENKTIFFNRECTGSECTGKKREKVIKDRFFTRRHYSAGCLVAELSFGRQEAK
jgi:hypothetical protein